MYIRHVTYRFITIIVLCIGCRVSSLSQLLVFVVSLLNSKGCCFATPRYWYVYVTLKDVVCCLFCHPKILVRDSEGCWYVTSAKVGECEVYFSVCVSLYHHSPIMCLTYIHYSDKAS